MIDASGMTRIITTWIILLSIHNILPAQELEVKGKFVRDSVKIGEDAAYYLSARYPAELNILFPDSTVSFFPFEYHSKQYFITHTQQGISYDSVVYHLRTFETDTIQTLSLPIYVIHASDCTAVYAAPDSIALKVLINDLPDSISLQNLPLKETVAFEPIPTSFNYIILSFGAGVLCIIAGTIWILFGKKIRRHYQLKRLQRNHSRFLEEFNNNISRLQTKPVLTVAESTAVLWKKYLETLESKPYTKLTTKEIIRLIQNEEVERSLHSIDRSIYGNQGIATQSFEGLKKFAEHEFRKKVEEVMNE